MKKDIQKLIISIASIIAVLGIYVAVCILTVRNYNHGICPKCHTEYIEQEVISKGTSYTKYRCEECGTKWIIQDILK